VREVEQVVRVRERARVGEALGAPRGPLRRFDRLVVAALTEPDARACELQLDERGLARVAGCDDELESARVAAERLVVQSLVLADDADLAQEARLRDGVAGDERPGPLVRVGCGAVAAEELGRVPQRLPDPRNLLCRQRGEVLARRERTLVELRRDDVRVHPQRAVARVDGVVPRFLVLLGLGEVEGQEPGELAALVACAPLERLAEPAVDLAPPAERQARVGREPKQVVPEAQRARALPRHELRQPVPALEVDGPHDAVAEDLVEQRHVEQRPDDGGIAQEQPVARVEPVDARRQQQLDALRQLGARSGCLRGRHELA
jgi:hypothetical protein